MHHLNLTHYSNKDVTPQKLQEDQDFQIKGFMPRSNLQEVKDKISMHE